MGSGWKIRDLKKFMSNQFGLSFWEDNKNYIRTVGITKEAFSTNKKDLSDCLYRRSLTNEKKMPRFIMWQVNVLLRKYI